MGGGSLFQSHTNYPLIFFFAGLGALGLVLAWQGWRQDSRVWRFFTAFYTATMFTQALYELSFAFVPVREWIRVDLLLTIPYGATGLTLLLGRWALRRWLQLRGVSRE